MSERRRAAERRAGDSGFVGLDEHSGLGADWFVPEEGAATPAWSKRPQAHVEIAQDSALARVYRTYLTARAAIGVGLVVVQGVAALIGSRTSELLALVSLAYAVQAITLWLLPRLSPFAQPLSKQARRRRQWMVTIGVDLLAFTCLHLLESGSVFNYGALLVLPVLMAGVFNSRLLALGTAAGVALLMLAVAWRMAAPNELPALMLQTGLIGLGLFVVSLMAGELAARLVREELTARGSMELVRQQAQLNRLVIEEMADGVLVVDQQLRVRAANPAARALLVAEGLSAPAPFLLAERPAWAELAKAVQQAIETSDWPEVGRDMVLDFGEGGTRTLRMRMRFMRQPFGARAGSATEGAPESLAVLLLEDLRTLQARIQQEKLAAMGRVSAGIAHEIRNPLAAIAQANALMLEDASDLQQRKLAHMVADNVERLKRLVDDVMEVAPGALQVQVVTDAHAVVSETAKDWAHTARLALQSGGRVQLDLQAAAAAVVFDPEHLRRVLVNLLDNAHRHASEAPAAVLVRLKVASERVVELSVLSDGPAIAPEVERYLFEPFFSTRSRGTGLGLYICRELCARYGASIEYERRLGTDSRRNEFVVRLQRHSLPLHP